MHNILVTLPDKSVKKVPKGTNSQEIASMIGERLSKSVVVSKINGVLSESLNARSEREINYPPEYLRSLALDDSTTDHEFRFCSPLLFQYSGLL